MANVNRPIWVVVHSAGGIGSNNLASTRHLTTYDIDRAHKDLWNFKSALGWYVGYHYVVEANGKMVQARSEIEEGAHTKGMNTSSIGICWTGNGDVELPTPEQESRLADLIREVAERWKIPIERIVPHRHFTNSKSCWGNLLSDEWARNLLTKYSPLPKSPEEKKRKEINILLQAYNLLLETLRQWQASRQLAKALGSSSESGREH